MKEFVPRSVRALGTVLVALSLLLMPTSASGVPARLTDDAHTVATAPNTNFAQGLVLPVGPTSNTYLKFDVTTLPAGTSGGDVAKATLTLWVNTVTASGSFDVRPVLEAWTEETIRAGTAPAVGGPVVTVPATFADRQSFLAVDLTGLIRAWLDGVMPNHGVALVIITPGTSLRFDSKENRMTSHEPRLDITLRGNGMPAGAMIFWDQGDCPPSFSLVTAYNERFLVASATAGVTGGSNSHAHGAGGYTLSGHAHSFTTGPESDGRYLTADAPGAPFDRICGGDGSCPVQRHPHTHAGTTSASEALPVTGVSGFGDSRPAFVTLTLCRKE